jgi:hypothetical protein
VRYERRVMVHAGQFPRDSEAEIPPEERASGTDIVHAAVRGAVGAMAMTGMRTFTVGVGWVEQPPPEAIFRRKRRSLLTRVRRDRRVAAIELVHWGYGAAGGAVFGLLPKSLRRRAWSGPAYGLAVWLGFELGIAPVLGLPHAKQPRPAERAALAADHLLYGFVLSELRRRPQA